MEGFVFNRAIAQLVARDVRDVEVAGSNPVCPTIKKKKTYLFRDTSFFMRKMCFSVPGNRRLEKFLQRVYLFNRKSRTFGDADCNARLFLLICAKEALERLAEQGNSDAKKVLERLKTHSSYT